MGMSWSNFHRLAIELNINDGNAKQLWSVLTGNVGCDAATASDGQRNLSLISYGFHTLITQPLCDAACRTGAEDTEVFVTRADFLRELSLWAPGTALETLDSQLCERFGNLAEGKRALARHLSLSSPLSPREFEAKLRSAGIRHCDVPRALSTVASQGCVSLDAVFETMQAMRQSGGKARRSAQTVVRNDTFPFWKQLRSVQEDLRHGSKEDGTPVRPASAPAFLSAVQSTSLKEGSPLKPGDRRRFSEAIHSAVMSAETGRSKSVLHCAHRQVLQLEERWASIPSSRPASAAASTSAGRSDPGIRRLAANRGSSVPTLPVTTDIGRPPCLVVERNRRSKQVQRALLREMS